MAGETDLDALLAGLDPVLHPGVLVWAEVLDRDHPAVAEAFAVVQEDEGTTVVLAPAAAERHGLAPEAPSRRIELRVHSDLAAVGLTAAVGRALAVEGISANVVAALHHDHVLVPADRAPDALAALQALSRTAGAGGPWAPVLDQEVAIALRRSVTDPDGFDVRLGVRGLGVAAEVRSTWDDEPVDDLVAALRGIADGGLGPLVVVGGRGPSVRFTSRGVVDGLWEVEVAASGAARDSAAMAATTLRRADAAAAADRVEALRRGV